LKLECRPMPNLMVALKKLRDTGTGTV